MEALKWFVLFAVIVDSTHGLWTSSISMSRWGWGQIFMAASSNPRQAQSEPSRGRGGAGARVPAGVPRATPIRWSNVRHDNQPFCDVLRSLTDTDQLVVVLVGLPGCGKSTVALEIANNSTSRWSIACQDVLKSRQKVWKAGLLALENGENLIVDRCNFDADQRDHWIRLAAEVQSDMRCQEDSDYSVDGNDYASVDGGGSRSNPPTRHLKRIVAVSVVLPNSNNVSYCADRANRRGNDGVHAPDTDWVLVCRYMRKTFSLPNTVEEAFAAVYICSAQEDLHTIINLLASVNSGRRR